MIPFPPSDNFASSFKQFQMTIVPVEQPIRETGLLPWILFSKMFAISLPASCALFVHTDHGLSTKFVALKTAAGSATAVNIPLRAIRRDQIKSLSQSEIYFQLISYFNTICTNNLFVPTNKIYFRNDKKRNVSWF